MLQTTSSILLIRPAHFGFNEETAESNSFQRKDIIETNLSEIAVQEFDFFANSLAKKGIELTIIEDTPLPVKPDAVFPNNWISMHADGRVILYPMCTPNRRTERRMDVVEKIKEQYRVTHIIDLSDWENKNKFLEGTGSIVFDHVHQTAYACSSLRTDKDLFLHVCSLLSYKPVFFTALDDRQKEIYHANVVMNIGEKFAVVCMDAIPSALDRKLIIDSLEDNKMELIEINFPQMMAFAGNMLSVHNSNHKPFLVLSQTAFLALDENQKAKLNQYTSLLPVNIPTIESVGGGSARCMMAEIFLPRL